MTFLIKRLMIRYELLKAQFYDSYLNWNYKRTIIVIVDFCFYSQKIQGIY